MEAKKLKTHKQALPRSVEGVVALFRHVVLLREVQEIRVTPTEFEVSRLLEADSTEDVVPSPAEKNDVEPEFLFKRLDLTHVEFNPDRHPYLTLVKATEEMTEVNVRPIAVMAPSADLFAAFFGLDDGAQPPHFLGLRMIYGVFGESQDHNYADKIVVVGGPTPYLSDATHGFIIDIGV
jgi:hypothetical protein